jgi:transcription elongation factor Elf1
MDNLISLNDKLKHTAARKAEIIHRRKIQAVRKIYQCTRCASKCERCGSGIGIDPIDSAGSAPLPYHFCGSCAQEYRDYIDQLQGKSDPDSYWHNEAWLKIWRQWIDYQGAIDQYKRSKEFLRLLNELRHEGGSCPD